MTSTMGRRGPSIRLSFRLPLLLATTALLATMTLAYDRTLRIDFPGPYCRVRNQCCSDRQDNCSREIAQTLCYCDEFCDRHEPNDCCPDYHSYCRNKPDPIISCLHNGIYFNIFNRTLDNCNQCLCLEGGRVVCDQDVCLTDNEVVRRVNNMHDLGWTARVYQQWWGHKYSEGLSKRLGAKVPMERIKSMRKLANSATGLPRTYNVLDRWSLYLRPIHDQGWCGSSWAISAASVASDRFAIQSHGMEVVQLSSQNIISCALTQDGCKGGHLDVAWRYLHKKGVLNETCYPYREANGMCMVVNETLRGNGCISFVGRDSLYKMGPPYALKGEKDIMAEIFKSGPLQATMHVYRDFFAYASGVYQKSPDHRGAPSGFHAVKLIGWGEEPNGKKYWIAANSWGTWWGEGGYFRIQRGVNECGIEDFALAAWPNLLRYYNFRSSQFNRNR